MDQEYKRVVKYEAVHGIHEAWPIALEPAWAKSKAGRQKRAENVRMNALRAEQSRTVDDTVKAKLDAGGFKVWQLTSAMNKPRITYYHWRSDRTLARHQKEIKNGFNKLEKHPERYRNAGADIKAELKKYGLTVSNLCQALRIPRSKYYTWCRHPAFNGHAKDVRKAVDHLIKINRKRP